MRIPTLILAFNRPDLTSALIANLRELKPAKLYLACDGARAGRPDDELKVAEVRRIFTEGVDWPCEVKTRFLNHNLGCRRAVSSAISWFFENEECGMILEDDCLPSPAFYSYCEELLEKYQSDDRVMMISGNNFFPELPVAESYFFSRLPTIWGWATWRRAWNQMDLEMAGWEQFRDSRSVHEFIPDNGGSLFWEHNIDDIRHGSSSWAFSWAYSLFKRGGLCVVPRTNLVTNIGEGSDATHGATTGHGFTFRETASELGPLSHPTAIVANRNYDLTLSRYLYREQLRPRRVAARIRFHVIRFAKANFKGAYEIARKLRNAASPKG